MLRVPSEISAKEFEALKIKDLTFVAYRSDVYPSKNDVYFEENAVIFVLEGKKKFSNPTQSVEVKKGDVLFIRRGFYLMTESIDQTYKSLVFFFDEKIIRDFVLAHFSLFEKSKKDDISTMMVLETDTNFRGFIDSIFFYFHSKSQLIPYFLKLKLQELLLHLLQVDKNGKLNHVLYAICEGGRMDLEFVMNNYYQKPLSLTEIARISGRSLSTFKRDFQDIFNQSPAFWIREKRMERAAFLIKMNNLSIAQIAEEVGYESVSHFIKVFKSKFGVTPNRFS